MITNKIDLVGRDEDGEVVLILMDNLSWDALEAHLNIIQEKVLFYVNAIETGEFNKAYPSVLTQPSRIMIVFEHEPPEAGVEFLNEIKSSLDDNGYILNHTLFHEVE